MKKQIEQIKTHSVKLTEIEFIHITECLYVMQKVFSHENQLEYAMMCSSINNKILNQMEV